jgi:hypothetical protein
MVSNTIPHKYKTVTGVNYNEEDFSLNLGRFIAARLFELKNKAK